jgi:hypothetical protein
MHPFLATVGRAFTNSQWLFPCPSFFPVCFVNDAQARPFSTRFCEIVGATVTNKEENEKAATKKKQ